MAEEKPIHTLVLDTGPIIRNHPTVSSLIAQAEELVTVPAIISEIKDAVTRARVETTLIPFLKLRTPKEDSFKFVSDFARKTGDLAVLSRVDLQIAALAYELECERNEGDWRLRRVPGQKRVNGAPPKKDAGETVASDAAEQPTTTGEDAGSDESTPDTVLEGAEESASVNDASLPVEATEPSKLAEDLSRTTIADDGIPTTDSPTVEDESPEDGAAEDASDSDGGEWITPSNLKRRQAQDADPSASSSTSAAPRMQVATMTTDNALQNLLLQINLNLVSGSLSRISTLRTTLLRCHACFLVHKKPDLQFCQRCGKPTLTRVTCTTDASGNFKVHLKKNIQWSHRGDRFSIPKPVAGSSNGKVRGGGKNGWGNDLVLAEDQKEYARAEERRRRDEGRDKGWDDDYLPGILTGRREKGPAGRMKVGPGRDVNSRKR